MNNFVRFFFFGINISNDVSIIIHIISQTEYPALETKTRNRMFDFRV